MRSFAPNRPTGKASSRELRGLPPAGLVAAGLFCFLLPPASSCSDDTGVPSDGGLSLDAVGALGDGLASRDAADGTPLEDGQEFVIQGSGFGSKEGPTLFYDDFESGSPGEPVTGGWVSDGGDVAYDRTHAFGGQHAALIDFPEGRWGNTLYLTNLNLDEIYVSYRVYVHDGGGTPQDGPQLKFARATSADTDVIHGDIDIGMTYLGAIGEGSGTWYNSGSEVPDVFWGESPPLEAWARIEMYLRLSDPPGEANGERWAKMNYGGDMTYSGYPNGHFADPYGTAGIAPWAYEGAPLVTRPLDLADRHIQNFVLPMFTRPEQVVSVWVDEVYLDSTQARVEIGDAPAWYDCTDRSPQPIESWSQDRIVIRLNQGRLRGDAYGFVVTAPGDIIPVGFLGTWQN